MMSPSHSYLQPYLGKALLQIWRYSFITFNKTTFCKPLAGACFAKSFLPFLLLGGFLPRCLAAIGLDLLFHVLQIGLSICRFNFFPSFIDSLVAAITHSIKFNWQI